MKKDPRFKKQEYNPGQVQGHLEGAKKKLKAAHKISDDDAEAAYQLAYEAMLKASLALILRNGLRPRSQPGHHIAIIEMAGKLLDDNLSATLKVFDEMRRNRNAFLYEADSIVSSSEVKDALELAGHYLQEIEKKL